MKKKYFIYICMLLLMSGALSSCQDSMDNEVLNDYDLFVRFEKASAQDFRNEFTAEELDILLQQEDRRFRYGYDRIRGFLENDTVAMVYEFERLKAIYHQIDVLHLVSETQQMIDASYLYSKEELLRNETSNTYKEFVRLANEKGISIDEILDTIYYDCIELACMDEVLAGYYFDNRFNFDITEKDLDNAGEPGSAEHDRVVAQYEKERYDALVAYDRYLEEIMKDLE